MKNNKQFVKKGHEIKADQIVVLGAGSQAKVVYDILECCQYHENILAFIDVVPNSPKPHQSLFDIPVRNANQLNDMITRLSETQKNTGIILAIGSNDRRKHLFSQCKSKDLPLLSVAHPSATISKHAVIEPGTTIHAQAVVGVDAYIENGVIVNTASTIDHDCLIEQFTQIAPGTNIAGNTRVGSETMIGAGATIAPNTDIGEHCFIESGAIVWGDVENTSRITSPQKNEG